MDITVPERHELAQRCGIEEQYLYQILTKRRMPSAELCVRIERHSFGRIMRWDLRDDWRDIWPELATRADAPKEAA